MVELVMDSAPAATMAQQTPGRVAAVKTRCTASVLALFLDDEWARNGVIKHGDARRARAFAIMYI
jgi:hypothetical protein